MPRTLVRTAIALALTGSALLATGCGSSEDPPANAKKLSFELTDDGCLPSSAKAPAGGVVFEVENTGTSKVTEFEVLDGEEIVGEKEDLTDGLSGEFDLDLDPGKYTIYCPGGTTERGTLTVTD